MTVYFGSFALAMPASKTPNRVNNEPAARSAPDATPPSRLRPPSTASPAPDTVHAFAARNSVPARPIVYGSLTMPCPCSILCAAASSTNAPTTATRRDGPASATGASAIVTPPPAAIADPANRNGSSSCGSCQLGEAVLASRTAVYVVIGPPNTDAPTAAPLRSPGIQRASFIARTAGNHGSACRPAVATVSALNGDRMYEPTDSGEVGLNTRSMCRNRIGRPRSTISTPPDATAPPAAVKCAAFASPGRRVNSPSAPITDDVPAMPPRKRYSGTSGFFHVAGLTMLRP